MNLKVVSILGLFVMLTAALEIPCTLYLYQSKPDTGNLYDATRSFVLPFVKNQNSNGVQLPLRENYDRYYITQYYEKPINSVKYIVAQGKQCDLCWIFGLARDYPRTMIDPPTPGEIYTLDGCLNYVEIGCGYYYPPDE